MQSAAGKPTLLVNGVPAGSLSLTDRALHYGDGLFETIAVFFGQAPLWQRHFGRLTLGCKRLGLPLPDESQLLSEIAALGLQQRPRAVVKLILSRGSGGRGYRPPALPNVQRLLFAYPWPDYPLSAASEGVRVRLCSTLLAISPTLAGLKHLNRLEQVLARSEWQEPEIAEGLMANSVGEIVEGTQSNLFLVHKGILITPPVDRSGVAGVMREVILELATALNITTRIEPVRQPQLLMASELFLTNGLIRIWPVRHYEGQTFPPPGPITRQLQQAVDGVMTSSGER